MCTHIWPVKLILILTMIPTCKMLQYICVSLPSLVRSSELHICLQGNDVPPPAHSTKHQSPVNTAEPSVTAGAKCTKLQYINYSYSSLFLPQLLPVVGLLARLWTAQPRSLLIYKKCTHALEVIENVYVSFLAVLGALYI